MKRILLVFAMLLISITMLAAHDSSIGISIAPESYWLTKASGQALPEYNGPAEPVRQFMLSQAPNSTEPHTESG